MMADRNGIPETSVRRDPVDGHERLAVHLIPTKSSGYSSASVDVLRADGSLLCRLNMFEFPKECGDVDVILDPTRQVGRFLAWRDGVHIVDSPCPGTTALAVDIRPREASK